MNITDPIVAAVQTCPETLNVRKNLNGALQLTYEAAGKGARLIVLPELCISGFNLKNVTEAVDVAQQRDGYQTEPFKQIADHFKCHIIFGYVELYNGLLYNSAAIVGPRGLEGNAQKHNLHGPDLLWAQASDALSPVVATAAGRTGALICRDIINNYRESYRFHSPQKRFYHHGSVDTIGLLTNWGGDYAFPDSSWAQLGEEIGCNVIVSNRVGSDRDLEFKGGSCVISRDGHIWTHGSSFDDEAVVGGTVIL